MGYKNQRIPCASISYYQPNGGSPTPDKRPRNRGLLREEGPPIDVERWGGGYRMIDGNDRLYYARQAGRSTISCRVWD